jgi:hypothetical protein
MKKKIIIATCAIALMMPMTSHAFSLKRFLTNPFNVKISNVFHPFYLLYKANKFTGVKPITFIPLASLRPEDTNWKYDPVKHEWEKYSWETNPYVPPPIYTPDLPEVPIRPNPPPHVVVAPPCQRGGQGITPC